VDAHKREAAGSIPDYCLTAKAKALNIHQMEERAWIESAAII